MLQAQQVKGVKQINIERSRTALKIAKDMTYLFTEMYSKAGTRMTRRAFLSLLEEVAYESLDVPKLQRNFKAEDKKKFVQGMRTLLKERGYTFFLRDDTNRLAVLMHIKLASKGDK